MSYTSVGLDLSLTSTGVAVLTPEKKHTITIKSKPLGKRPIDEFKRVNSIVKRIEEYIKINTVEKVNVVVIENLAFGVTKSISLTQLAGLNYLVRQMCCDNNWLFMLVAPTTLKKFLTGKGNSQKDIMMLEAYKKYGVTLLNNNEVDAFALGKIGELFMPGSEHKGISKHVVELIKTQI